MAIWLPDLKALFVHIPRCGGTWVTHALEASGLRMEPGKGAGTHNTPDRYDHEGFRFTFVRHPVTWLESVWRGLHSSWPNQTETPVLFNERSWSAMRHISRTCSEREFPLFIRNVLEREPGVVSRLYEAYTGFPGVPKVNAVGRLENVRSDLQSILARCGWKGVLPEIPPANVGEADPPAWNDVFKERVIAAEAPAIRRFYSSEGPFFLEETW